MTITTRPIEPLAPLEGGTYSDDLVVVRRLGHPKGLRERPVVRTPHFDLATCGDRLVLGHTLTGADLDEDLTGILRAELFDPGWVRGADLFERLFTGVVRSVDPDPVGCWEVFYRNTLRRIEELDDGAGSEGGGHGSIAEYAPVYRECLGLLAGESVLELGCCFGFLAMLTAQTGRRVVAVDITDGTVRLVNAMAERLEVAVAAYTADAAHVPVPEQTADTVLAIHLLEHVDADHGQRVIDEALRIARQRVVIAVPLENDLDLGQHYGHVRTIGLADLDRWGRATGREYTVWEHHGGWLQIEM